MYIRVSRIYSNHFRYNEGVKKEHVLIPFYIVPSMGHSLSAWIIRATLLCASLATANGHSCTSVYNYYGKISFLKVLCTL